MAKKSSAPGVYRLKTGGFFIRARVTDVTGKRSESTAVLHDVKTVREAQRRRDRLIDDARAAASGQIRTQMPWSEYAASLVERRVRKGSIKSAATRDWWAGTLAVLIPAFGRTPVTEVRRVHIQAWLDTTVAEWMAKGKPIVRKRRVEGELVERTDLVKVKPPTVNGWLRILRTISHSVAKDYELPKSAFDGIEFFDEDDTYSRENPNALPPTVLPEFMRIARAMFPQHFTMMLLGFVTGLRPSSMRPLRRKGPEQDIDWSTGLLYVRRSHSRRQDVMNTTKTKKKTSIALPASMLVELERHSAELDEKGIASELLFPGRQGKMRTRTVLTKPFAAIVEAMKLPFNVTPRGMRRTFNDVARAAGMNDVVTMSISGHVTDKMRLHYSTAQDEEQRSGLSRVLSVVTEGVKRGGNAGSDDA